MKCCDIPIEIVEEEIVSPITLRKLLSDKISKLIPNIKKQFSDLNNYQLVKLMLENNGLISGGFVTAMLMGGETKDIDMYFNDEDAYMWAYSVVIDNPFIDICWYKNLPIELHDISFVKTYYDGNKIFMTVDAYNAITNLVSEIYIHNIIYPERTFNRIIKYNKRYGVKFKYEQIVALCAIYDFEIDKLSHVF